MMAGHQLGFTEQGTANILTAFHIYMYKSDQFKEMLKTLQVTYLRYSSHTGFFLHARIELLEFLSKVV
jgi:hypothetical protein